MIRAQAGAGRTARTSQGVRGSAGTMPRRSEAGKSGSSQLAAAGMHPARLLPALSSVFRLATMLRVISSACASSAGQPLPTQHPCIAGRAACSVALVPSSDGQRSRQGTLGSRGRGCDCKEYKRQGGQNWIFWGGAATPASLIN